MSGSTSCRRVVVAGLVLALWLLPLSSANAAPRGGAKGSMVQIQELGRILVRSIEKLLRSFPMPNSMPPGQQPGNSGPGTSKRDGIGIDPNGNKGN